MVSDAHNVKAALAILLVTLFHNDFLSVNNIDTLG